MLTKSDIDYYVLSKPFVYERDLIGFSDQDIMELKKRGMVILDEEKSGAGKKMNELKADTLMKSIPSFYQPTPNDFTLQTYINKQKTENGTTNSIDNNRGKVQGSDQSIRRTSKRSRISSSEQACRIGIGAGHQRNGIGVSECRGKISEGESSEGFFFQENHRGPIRSRRVSARIREATSSQSRTVLKSTWLPENW